VRFTTDSPRPTPPQAPAPKQRGGVLRVLAFIAAGLLVVAGGAGLVGAWVVHGYLADAPQMPSREALWGVRRSPSMTFLDRAGAVIATRGARYGQAVTLANLPAFVPKAFLAAEDRRFYQHGPVDLHAIARALNADIRAGRSVQGASTLTQQLARSLFLQRDQSLKRKVQEAYLAWKLEQQLSKDEILELFMNRTFFGAGAYGLDAASRTYFGKPASQLSLSEAAVLADLPNAPSRLALTRDMPAALARSHRVLQAMLTEGWISQGQYLAAVNRPPMLAQVQNPGEGDMGYVLDQAAEEAGQLTDGTTPDLVVATTIDPALETAAFAAVRGVVGKEGARRGVTQGALVSLASDGAILAMVGGMDHDKSSFNRVTQARRQPGSSFKAFVFGAAVERGLTPNDVRTDGPISLAGWSPENYGRSYSGPVTLRSALARSLNTVSVRLTLEVGADAVASFARRLGVADIPEHPGPSIALGAYEVTPLEMAAGYQVFQTGGGRTAPYLVREIRSTRGQVLYAHAASAPTPVLDPLYATRMVDMLKAVVTSGTGTGANIGRPMAGKTGTSQNWRDAWFVGFTPDILTAVWVGNDNGRPMAKVTGGELPAAIWRRFMTVAEKDTPPQDFPWLVAEPPGQTSTTVADAGDGAYEDQPPDMSGDDGMAQQDPDEAPPVDRAGDADGGGDAYAQDTRGGDWRGRRDDAADWRDHPRSDDRGGYDDPSRDPPARADDGWRRYRDIDRNPAPSYDEDPDYRDSADDGRRYRY